ncbi:GNAT family N-acetyltransferase [Cellulomonas carbonis]|uniref:N-acetyltransferase domain-containing protein n=1 Tax=Cellulomonas carbonis T26 TaxID=947969 RepID=A0A0A0BRI2_9CELL|nr:GNAT family N-acetyltransferase [Cellulomonas carbonis]KGM10565.1 hypothetical protein N868_13485 [Cellulomonas carbonis T26]GGC02105.1 hypothetical protein GCM10010972_13810 [Cellulomonas carbonis]
MDDVDVADDGRSGPGAERPLTRWVQRAHADAWRELALCRPDGAVLDLPGATLVSSGLPFPQYNGADVSDPTLVDVDAVGAWFAARGLPWAWRLPAGTPWPHGPLVVRQRLMGARPDELLPAAAPDGLVLRAADPEDLGTVAAVDVEAFGGDVAAARAWIGPQLAATHVTVGLALLGGEPVGTAYTVRSDGAAGPAVLLAGVGVVPRARGRGVAAALSSWLVAESVEAGAELAHLQPDDERAARVYARLGFSEVGGLDIRAAPEGPSAS